MVRRWAIPLIALPGTVVVVVPLAILWFSSSLGSPPSWTDWWSTYFCIGVALAAIGGSLATWSAAQFFRHGEGTPAPWDPPTRFVARGPYRYVRNPMILGVILMLFAEALLLKSWWLTAWGMMFAIGNAAYLLMIEEPALEKRFGSEYAAYRRSVRRWLPRLSTSDAADRAKPNHRSGHA